MKGSTVQRAKKKLMAKGLDPLRRVKAVPKLMHSSKTKKDLVARAKGKIPKR